MLDKMSDANFVAEQALNTLIEAGRIEGDKKLMQDVEEVARNRALEATLIADQFSEGDVPRGEFSARDREGRVNF